MRCFVFDTCFSFSNIIFLTNFLRYSLLQLRNPPPFVHSVLQLLVHIFNSVKFVIFSSSPFTSCRLMLIFLCCFFSFPFRVEKGNLSLSNTLPQNRFCCRSHSSGMCHAFEYLTDFNKLKLKVPSLVSSMHYICFSFLSLCFQYLASL